MSLESSFISLTSIAHYVGFVAKLQAELTKEYFCLKIMERTKKYLMKPKRIAIGSGPNEVLLYVKISFLSRNLFTPVNCSDKIAKSFL